MTFVDDSLTGTVPLRGGKSGGKGAKQAEIAAQKDAFNQAFSDAGKKQPQISIRDKFGADGTETQSRISIQSPVQNGTAMTSNTETAIAADTDGGDFQLPVEPATGEPAPLELPEEFRQVEAEPQADPAPQLDKKIPLNSEGASRSDLAKARAEAIAALAGDEAEQIQIPVDPEASSGDVPAIDADVVRKLADLFKERQAEMTKSSASGKPSAGKEKADSENTEAAVAASTDVDQLLVMLGAAQAQVEQSEAPTQTSSALSEFQALAERAGKAKPVSKEADAATKAGAATNAATHTATHGVETTDVPAAEAKVEADQVFRFARADGKGQEVSISIGADGDKATIDTGGTPAAKAETVTVLEARRYLGIAPSSNAQAVTTAIAGDAEWAQSIQQTSATGNTTQQQATGKVLNTLKIQMHPIDLGMVTVTLRLKDDELQVDLKVETGDAFRQLRDDQGDIVKALRAQGFAVDKVNVVFNAPDSNNGAQQQQQPQAGGQQAGREASAGGSGAQGREQRGNSGNEQSQGERWTANETTGEPSAADAGRSGNVYI
ncbi:flagellar hook-length control protein FliK [Pararhizobium arenae]|uniref:flagellar hook-length control protein FliK n=1 Tax=Pararhizobium arenae TaxID=1856850 RepID=UPI00094AE093|nr:flagellar hook-length control protein FliK [Pararhizobium arenae]